MVRPAGDIYLDLEVLYDELVESHDMQMGDLMYWLYGHLKIHRPDCIEEYLDDGKRPEFRYGPGLDRESTKKNLLKLFKENNLEISNSEIIKDILRLFEKECK